MWDKKDTYLFDSLWCVPFCSKKIAYFFLCYQTTWSYHHNKFFVIHKKFNFRSGYRWNVNHCANSALPIRCLYFNSTVLSMIARATEFCICLHASVKAVGVKLRGTLKKSLCFCSNASKPRCVFFFFYFVSVGVCCAFKENKNQCQKMFLEKQKRRVPKTGALTPPIGRRNKNLQVSNWYS